MNENTRARQRRICEQFGAEYFGCEGALSISVGRNVRCGLHPLNGLRIAPDDRASGWYIWAGEQFSLTADFFVTVTVAELADWAPHVMPYLGLPPGWRFVVTDKHEDAWRDADLVKQD
ncbi:MAG TPA: hypothetical protein VL424_01550 [Pararobbsia sp.]|nr:hypothetical protein [Pararobbsia sp.]